MLKKNKVALIVSSAVILLPMLAGVILWERLPPQMVTHWGTDGTPDGWSGKAFTVFGIPLVLLAFQWLCVLITDKDKKNADQSKNVMRMVLWICPFLTCFVSAMMYAVSLGKTVDVSIWTVGLLGLMFIVLGNYMPKCKPNSTIGIKIKWTLVNEENWNKTHRLAGKVWVIGGILQTALCFVVPEKYVFGVLFAFVLLLVLIPCVYSYTYYKKQIAAGTADRNAKLPMNKSDKIIIAVVMVLVLLLTAVCLVSGFTGDVTLQYGDTAFTVQADWYADLTVDYASIDSAEYRETFQKGRRTNGFGSPRLSMGQFENEEFGAYTLYGFTETESAVVLRSDGNILVLNGKDEAQTVEMFNLLQEKIQ